MTTDKQDLQPTYFLSGVDHDASGNLVMQIVAELENEDGQTEQTHLTQTIPNGFLNEITKRVGQALKPEQFHKLFDIADNAVKKFGSTENLLRETLAWLNSPQTNNTLAVGSFLESEYHRNLALVQAAYANGELEQSTNESDDCNCSPRR